MPSSSPHLSSVAERIFPQEIAAAVVSTFELTVAWGGKTEHGFSREEGVSFNPRPARIGLIMLNDVGERNDSVVRAAILAAVIEQCSDDAIDAFYKLPSGEKVVELARMGILPIDQIESIEGPDRLAAGSIACAIFLDLMRHFHQTQLWAATADKTEWLRKVEPYIRLSNQTTPKLTPFFQSWCDRIIRSGAGSSNS